MEANFQVHVLIRCSKKTGKIDTVMTALSQAMLNMWALQNTTSSKQCYVFNRETGELVFATDGTKDGFPKVRDAKKSSKPLGTCEDLGLSLEDLQELGYDDRFDKEEV